MADGEFYRSMLLKPYESGFVNGGPHQLERPNFFIVPQGRCAEFLLFSTLGDMIAEKRRNDCSAPTVIISNGFFDTTGANAIAAGFSLETFTQPGLTDPFPEELVGKQNPFKGNLDLAATETFLDQHQAQVCMILITITNNWAAAQPVSMANIRGAAELARRRSIPLFFDACRFAENAWFIREFESGYSDKTIPEIVQEMFSYVDGFTISLKKDGLSNMGGILSFRDGGLLAQQYDAIGLRLKERQILCYGNDSYGGMSGRDIMTAVVGLYEVTKEPYLRTRINQVRSFAEKLQADGVSVLLPPGGHAVYLNMDEFFHGCDRHAGDFPAVGFTLELLKDFGIRAAEAGPFGWEWDKKPPELQAKIPNLVRFAVPRHVLSDQHINYTVAAIKELHNRRHSIPNVKITRGKNMRLRHFSAGMKPIPVNPTLTNTTYLREATRQLSHLSRALDQDSVKDELLNSALGISMEGWGQLPIPQDVSSSRWVSGVSNDHSPFEYSVVLDQETGDTELRFLIEAQPLQGEGQGNLTQLQAEAFALAERIADKNRNKVSLDRFRAVRDLFMPSKPEGSFAAWFSYASGKDGAEWKIYLNPCCTPGRHDAISRTRAAFERIGLAESWAAVESVIAPYESVVYFSLDLSSDSNHSRAKVYVSHGTSSTASAIAEKHAAICPHANPYEIQRFCEAMGGGNLGPYEQKPLLSCFAFTSRAPGQPVGTVHFPVSAYAGDDREIQERIERYMVAVSVPSLYKKRYRKIISAVQRRPLDQGVGVHAWVSLKQGPGDKRSNTFYISPGLFLCRREK
ncbi:pyridoxal phosphate-dependent transferase [Annulohypoxylon truncatum]|uniref:pyridoxal phosphate-dependent transferase n=1 Tax=Annulohypoxylon truncatum TaxID=327061 RepID=UPI0020072FDA|nr:pyridoxal phosphate-dependent transferase [Annulohypoxylon truncatum]KAI1210831.1 pyridoxal phosphate-dependent transferase [Annulohypoxylon truncatum]